MRETLKKSIFSRLLSGTLALAVALSMAFVAMPQKVLAESNYFMVWEDGSGAVTFNENVGNNFVGSADYTTTLLPSNVSYDSATNTLTLTNANIDIDLSLGIKNEAITIVIIGNCTINNLAFQYHNSSDTVYSDGIIQMTKGSSLSISKFDEDPWTAGYTNPHLTIRGGDITSSGISANSSAIAGSSIEVGSVAYEQNKTPSTSASYKVTSTDEGNRTVTYDKPAEGAEGTEQVKATVTLTDGNTYTVTAISENAFNNFENKNKIKKIEIADTVKEIGNNACKDMAELTDVTGGKGVTSIGKGAFSNCSKLKNFSGFDNLEIINDEAFNKCKKLTKVTIGVKVKKIGKKAYYECSSLKNITVKSTKLTKKSKVGAKAFGKIHKKAKFKMKMSKKDAKKYKTKTIKVFKNKSIGYVNTWKVS